MTNPKMKAARNAIVMDAPNGVFHQHMFVCHSDGSKCVGGCDVLADPEQVAWLNAAFNQMQSECD